MNKYEEDICPHRDYTDHSYDIDRHTPYDTITVRCVWCGKTITYDYTKEKEQWTKKQEQYQVVESTKNT